MIGLRIEDDSLAPVFFVIEHHPQVLFHALIAIQHDLIPRIVIDADTAECTGCMYVNEEGKPEWMQLSDWIVLTEEEVERERT